MYSKSLAAGQTTTLVYFGPDLPITEALASISGAYDAVFYTQPKEHGGQVYPWYPGQSNPGELLETGALISVHIKPGAPAVLTFPVAGTPPEASR